jgi:microsomal dipeptidase-like Zn-dependent dipeptidase
MLEDIKKPKLKTTQIRTGSFSKKEDLMSKSSNRTESMMSPIVRGSGYQQTSKQLLETKQTTARKRTAHKKLAAAAAMDGADAVLADLGVLRPRRKSHLRKVSTVHVLESEESEGSNIEL